MKTFITACARQSNRVRLTAAAMLAIGALAGCGLSTAVSNAAAFEGPTLPVAAQRGGKNLIDDVKISLIGSYRVTGTETDGKAYQSGGVVDVSLAPSGSLELNWDNGRQVGVGQVLGNTLVVSHLTNGRTAIMVMNINPGGTLSGTWARRTDRGYRGTETWKKM
jgi:hypothetical protein